MELARLTETIVCRKGRGIATGYTVGKRHLLFILETNGFLFGAEKDMCVRLEEVVDPYDATLLRLRAAGAGVKGFFLETKPIY